MASAGGQSAYNLLGLRLLDPLPPLPCGVGPRSVLVMRGTGRSSLAAIVADGRSYEVDRPAVIPVTEATAYFRPRERRMHRQFHVDTALQVRQRQESPR